MPPVYPVISLVLYFGRKKWNTAKTLKGCIDYPDYLDPFVADYPINLFEIAHLPDETVDKFESDFKLVARYFTETRKLKEGLIDQLEMPMEDIVHVEEVLELLEAMTGDKHFTEAYNKSVGGGGPKMDEVLDMIIKKACRETRIDTILSLFHKSYITEDDAIEELNLSPDEFREADEK